MSTSSKAPTWFMIVAILGFLWNLVGLWGYIASINIGPDTISEVPERMRGIYEDGVPWFYWPAYGLAVIGGTLGCIALILKQKWATLLFSLSLIGVLVFNTWTYLFSGMADKMISEDYIIQTLVIIVGILLLFLSKSAQRKGWFAY